MSRAVGVLLVSATVVLASCSAAPGGSAPVAQRTPAASAPSSVGPTAPLGVDPVVVARVARLCAAGPGKTVTELGDVVLSEVRAPGLRVPEQRIGTRVVPAVEVPEVSLPATVAEAGCVVEFAAPAGCLPRVEISPAWIPGVRLPGYRLDRADGSGVEVPAVEAAAVVVAGAVAEQACRVEGGHEPGTHRAAARRPLAARGPLVRGGASREGACDGSACVLPVGVGSLLVAAVHLESVFVPGEWLPVERWREGVDAAASPQASTYTAAEGVLFGYNRSDLVAEATVVLDEIVADATAKASDGVVRVEGHTDDTGTVEGNLRLSERRAEAVAEYLVAAGIARTRITVTGRGEGTPAYPNDTDQHRAQNRRVVIEFQTG